VRLGADVTSNSTTLANVTGLALPVSASTAYTFSFYVLYQSAATTTGIGLSVTTPSGSISYTVAIPGAAADGLSALWTGWGTFTDDPVISTATPATGTTYVAHVYGVVHTGAGAGNLQLRLRSEVAASTVTVKADSWGALEVG
jgi:hypothetical protein